MTENEMSKVTPDHLPAESEQGSVAVAEPGGPFADPGMPPHEVRKQDIDEEAAKRSERTVAFLFILSMLATIGFIASFVAFPVDEIRYVWPMGHVSILNLMLGLTLGISLFCIGAGAVHWARTLMTDVEIAEDRHGVAADAETKAKAVEDFRQGAEESGFGRRKLLRNTMIGAMAMVPLAGVILLRDLGPLPEDKLRHTLWGKGKLLVNVNTNEPLKPADITQGSLAFAKPEGLEEHDHDFNKEIAKAAVMLIRIAPEDIKDQQSLDWGHDGILCYSKICTHVGCPVSLYEQQTHHVLCPCHQSTFDLSDGARVIFGPAGHPLPQLKITVNDEGFLEALGDFEEPVGPSFWERG